MVCVVILLDFLYLSNGSFLCRAECAGSEAQNLASASRPTAPAEAAPAHRNPAPPQAEISQEDRWTELEQPLMLDHERRLERKDRLYGNFIGSNPSREKAVTVRKRRRLAWLWLALVIMEIDDPCANKKSESLKELPVYKGSTVRAPQSSQGSLTRVSGLLRI